MKGKYITIQVLLACKSKPVSRPVVKVSYPTTKIIVRENAAPPAKRRELVEA